MNKVIVAVSGKRAVHPAIRWAVEYAGHHGLDVELAHVIDLTWGAIPEDFAERALLAAEHQMRSEADRAASLNPKVRVHPVVLLGSPNRELVERAQNAALLVVSSHPTERFGRQAFSRRAARIASAATCTVVIVPSEERPGGHGVVVGVDGSEASAAAVEFAAQEAMRFGDGLKAVYAWQAPTPWGDAPIDWPSEPSEEDKLVLAEATAGLGEQDPGLLVEREVVMAAPAAALEAAARGARLLVVGTHRTPPLAKALIGSVSEEVALSMPCVVAIARPVGTEV